jgi:hypothetical protein
LSGCNGRVDCDFQSPNSEYATVYFSRVNQLFFDVSNPFFETEFHLLSRVFMGTVADWGKKNYE